MHGPGSSSFRGRAEKPSLIKTDQHSGEQPFMFARQVSPHSISSADARRLEESPALGGKGLAMSAASVVRMLAPKCNSAVFGRLNRERVRTAADLSTLDKDDLRALGLTMVERGRVLRWAHEAFPAGGTPGVSPDTSPGTPGYGFGAELCSLARTPINREISVDHPSDDEGEQNSGDESCRLDDIETQADFWCSLVSSTTPIPRRRAVVQGMSDVRENVLEDRFDVTSERVAEVYNDMFRQSLDPGGRISVQELASALRRCGLAGLDDNALSQVILAVKPHRNGGLTLAEFETILSRLKLAQMFVCPNYVASPNDDVSNHEAVTDTTASSLSPLRHAAAKTANVRLRVIDYNAHRYSTLDVTDAKFREFCFGHRSRPRGPHESPLVRWVHFAHFDLTTLLCLTVKYSLHPLGVEDVIEQCPTKIDRYGSNYFAAVEQLCLVGDPEAITGGRSPVRVAGFHVAAFCSGPPLFDTLITVAQPDRSFASDWPGASEWCGTRGHCWSDKLRQRLMSAPRSRLRERRADFILYHIIDLSTDEVTAVIQAYTARLARLESMALNGPSRSGYTSAAKDNDPCSEASTSRLQLKVVMRRVRGLQRVLRHFSSDPDFSSELSGYLQDVAEHLDEAYEDATQLVEKCTSILEVHQRAIERTDEKVRQRTADRLNKTLFVLTVGTFIFAPMQFLAAVYGMNFVDEEGNPTIPELLMGNGYMLFWLVTLGYLFMMLCFTAWWYLRIRRRSAEDVTVCEEDLDV